MVAKDVNHFKKKGRLIIISSPSGGGKTTIVRKWLALRPDLKRSVSYTTRPKRSGEHDGKDYHFISRSDFLTKRKHGFFLEWARVFGHFYGSSKTFCLDWTAKGYNVVLTIDVQGTRKVLKRFQQRLPIITVFVTPPSTRTLEERLVKRKTDSKIEIAKRLRIAKEEMKARREYDYVVMNRSLTDAVQRIDRVLYKKALAS